MKLLKKLNQKGFGHHILVPLVVIVLVASVGSYVLLQSHAEELPTSSNASSTTFLVTNGAPSNIENDINHYRYYLVNSSNGNSTEVKHNGSPLGLGSGYYVSDDEIGASTSKDLSQIIGARGPAGNGIRVYSVNDGTFKDLSLNAGPKLVIQNPVLSPDGTQVAYRLVHTDSGPFPVNDVYIASSPNGNINQLIFRPVRTSKSEWEVKWQPVKGKKISYVEQLNPGGGLTFTYFQHLYDVDTQKDITLDGGSNNQSAWSYDGTMLAYQSKDYKVHVVTSDGNAVKTLSLNMTTNDNGGGISFSPKSNSLVFTSHGSVKEVNIQSGSVTTVLNKPVQDLKWLSDGRIAFVDNGVVKILSSNGSVIAVKGMAKSPSATINYPNL